MNIITILIFTIPFSLVLKGFYYLFLTYLKESSKISKYSIIKTDNPLDFYQKNKSVSNAYFILGSIISIFIVIINICFFSNKLNRLFLVLLITFISDLFISQLCIIKIKMIDYDNTHKRP